MDHPDEPLVALIRTLADSDPDPRRRVHLQQLADQLAQKLTGVDDQRVGDQLWADDYFYTLARMIGHLDAQLTAERQRIDALERMERHKAHVEALTPEVPDASQ